MPAWLAPARRSRKGPTGRLGRSISWRHLCCNPTSPSHRWRRSRASFPRLPRQPRRGSGLDQQLRVDIRHDAQIERLADLLIFTFATRGAALGQNAAIDEVAEL